MKKSILLLWCWALVLGAQAQTKLLFDESAPVSFLLKRTGSGTSQATVNSLLDLLQQAQVQPQRGGRPNRSAELTVRLEQQARIADLGDQLQLNVQLRNVSVSGDVLYKGFDLSDALLPAQYKATVQLLDGKGKVVKTYATSINLQPSSSVLLETTIPDSAATPKYKLKLTETDEVYTAASLATLQERLKLVQAYYAADANLDEALQRLNRIQPEDVDRLPQHDRHLHELEEQLADLRQQKLKDKLNLRQNDPKHLQDRMQDLGQLLQERRRALDYALATLDQQFYNRGVSLLRAGNEQGAQAYFVKSAEVNPKFAPALVQLARLDFLHGYTQEAAHQVTNILTHLRLDPETENAALGLAHDIYSTYISQGNSLTNGGSYREALATFADAQALCGTVGGLRCNLPALHDGVARAATGAYRNLVEEGKHHLRNNDLSHADAAAQAALEFQQQYDEVLHGVPAAADLQRQVKYQYYLRHIDQGKRFLSQQNYEAALDEFEEAFGLEGSYALTPVQELGRLAQQAAKPVLLQQLSKGYAQATENRLSDARATATAALALQNRYALQTDKEVQGKYNLLRDRIFTQECLNTQSAYDEHFQNGKRLASQKQFLAADQAYKAALAAAAAKPECAIATFTATDAREAIRPAAVYQQLLADAERFVAGRRYTEAIQAYNEAEQQYLANGVSRFGLDHTSLLQYAGSSKALPFTASVVTYFANAGQEEVAVQLLASLLERGYRRGKTKHVQEQLGRQLAIRDAQRALPEEAKVLSARYTSNRKDLKQLGKAYLKERKKLIKS